MSSEPGDPPANGSGAPPAAGRVGHCAALAVHRARAHADGACVAFAVCGSVARGEARPASDLDLVLILRDGARSRPFAAEETAGVYVETKAMTSAAARARMSRNPMELYTFLDARALDDPAGRFADLQVEARRRFTAFKRADLPAVRSWMASVDRKLRAADGPFQAAYAAGVSIWPILDAIWAVNGKPTPPMGAVWAHLADLAEVPPRAWLDDLVFATPGAAGRLTAWVLERLP